MSPSCPACGRPVALAGPRCLYCGAPLGEAALSAPLEKGAAAPAVEEDTGRSLVVVGFDGVRTASAARALGLGHFEAGQRTRRGGFSLHRSYPAGEAEQEAARLRAAGLPAYVIPESEARAALRPLLAAGGHSQGDALELRTASLRLTMREADLLLVVRGPIARAYQTAGDARRIRTATLEPGFRIHLHRQADPRPVELDPAAFAFDGRGPGATSSLLHLLSWVDSLFGAVPADEGFAREPPALGVAEPEEGPLSAVQALQANRPRTAKGERVVLDNLRQFRFYSGWRAALERRRARGASDN